MEAYMESVRPEHQVCFKSAPVFDRDPGPWRFDVDLCDLALRVQRGGLDSSLFEIIV